MYWQDRARQCASHTNKQADTAPWGEKKVQKTSYRSIKRGDLQTTVRGLSMWNSVRSMMLQTQWASLIWAPDPNNIGMAKKSAWIFFFFFGKIFVGGASGKEPSFQCRRHKRFEFDLWVRKFPWRRAWQPSPVFLPGESHGQRSLEGYKSIGWLSWSQLKWLSIQHYWKNPNQFWPTQYFYRMVKRGQPDPM